MERLTGVMLLQGVADRILAAYLESAGYGSVRVVGGRPEGYASSSVDLTYRYQGLDHKVKVKPDAYYGTDPVKVRDRNLTFYRSDAGAFAFESISNHMTREPGWMFDSTAEYLYYYYLVITQTEEEVSALLSEPDEIFFSELKVDRDDLFVLPMKQTQEWFNDHFEEYAPRPVTIGDHSAWFRMIPRQDIEGSVAGIKNAGSVFSKVARG